jgi:predicted metal-dependent enzyme (double-stranded beta helix superfamily)
MAFDLERFVEDCRTAVTATDGPRAVRELLERAVSDPTAAAALGEPEHAGVVALYRSAELTIIDSTWAPWMILKPHNHNMWAVIAIVSGREDNLFWRRTAGGIEAAGARSASTGMVFSLGEDIIHSVVNPISRTTRALHVYGGDFFDPPVARSEWDPDTLCERPWDLDDTRRMFLEAEARARAGKPQSE